MIRFVVLVCVLRQKTQRAAIIINNMKENDLGSYYSQAKQWPEEFDPGAEVGARIKKY